jgi:hypothetical protein
MERPHSWDSYCFQKNYNTGVPVVLEAYDGQATLAKFKEFY